MHTLLLNASYEPLRVIPVTRAIVLVLADRAEVVTEGPGVLRSPSVTMAVPSVIRLRRYVSIPYRRALPLTRRNLFARDQHRCAYCGRRGDTVDHVVPRSRGGRNVWENVVCACGPCNTAKADALLSELGPRWQLGFVPTAPAGWSWLTVGVATLDPAWAPWVPDAVCSA